MVCFNKPWRPQPQFAHHDRLQSAMEKLKIERELVNAAGDYHSHKHLMSMERLKFAKAWEPKPQHLNPTSNAAYYATDAGKKLQEKVSELQKLLEEKREKAIKVLEKKRVEWLEENAEIQSVKLAEEYFRESEAKNPKKDSEDKQ